MAVTLNLVLSLRPVVVVVVLYTTPIGKAVVGCQVRMAVQGVVRQLNGII
jgi:hypothetical protein